jgi:hypothetical protein
VPVGVAAAHLDRSDHGQGRDASDGHRAGLFLQAQAVGHRIVPAATIRFRGGQHAGQAHGAQPEVVIFGVAQTLGDHGIGLGEPVVVDEHRGEVGVGPPGEVAEVVLRRNV